MTEEELINLIRKTVIDWAIEEFASNQYMESRLTLQERYEENWQTFMPLLRAEMEKGFSIAEERYLMKMMEQP